MPDQPSAPPPSHKETGVDLWISRLIRVAGLGITTFQTFAANPNATIVGAALLMMSGTLAYDAIRRKLQS